MNTINPVVDSHGWQVFNPPLELDCEAFGPRCDWWMSDLADIHETVPGNEPTPIERGDAVYAFDVRTDPDTHRSGFVICNSEGSIVRSLVTYDM